MLTRPFGPTGVPVSVIGQGTWHMGEDRRLKKDEIAALRLGIELGLSHIDTAEMYADGQAEEIVAEAVAGQRDRVFIATKVLPSNASYKGTLDACERSLKRLRTDHVDLYLLHWWSGQHPIEDTMRALVALCASGKTPRQVALNFLTHRPALFAIPKATRPEHVRENAGALDFTLTPEDLSAIDAEHRR
ncbi:MAG: aldo/keto reductase [Candidatus Rokubacteria bacterium]|nr:aldo/keto reductase [Candidatus Rokubacteria bacterium]